MEQMRLIDLRKRLQEERQNFPFLPAYLGPWGMRSAIKRQLAKGDRSPELEAFAKRLDEYIGLGQSYLKEEGEEVPFVIEYCLDAFRDVYYEFSEDLLKDLTAYFEKQDFIPSFRGLLLYDLVLGYRRIHFPWRGKKYARALREHLKSNLMPRAVYADLASYYRLVLDFVSASEVALDGAKALLKNGERKDAAYLCQDGLASATVIPGYEFPSEEQIREAYQDDAIIVLQYPRVMTVKHDPVEVTPAFQQAYDEVMEKAMAHYLKDGLSAIVQQLWIYMRDGFKKKGIAWKSPQDMNPGMKFD